MKYSTLDSLGGYVDFFYDKKLRKVNSVAMGSQIIIDMKKSNLLVVDKLYD